MSKPVLRRNSHALAWSRVGLGFVADLHLGAVPADELVDGAALGGAHVGGGDDAESDAAFLEPSSAGSRRRIPVHRMKAQSRSTLLADSISARSSAARFGSSLPLVSRAESTVAVSGRRRFRRRNFSGA